MKNKIICILGGLFYLGIGIFLEYSEKILLIGLTVFFVLGICFFLNLISFIKKKKIIGLIKNANYGYTEMKRAQSNRYYIEYTFKGKKYEKRLKYSTSDNFKVGTNVNILVNNKNNIILEKDLKIFFLFDILCFIITIIFLYLG